MNFTPVERVRGSGQATTFRWAGVHPALGTFTSNMPPPRPAPITSDLTTHHVAPPTGSCATTMTTMAPAMGSGFHPGGPEPEHHATTWTAPPGTMRSCRLLLCRTVDRLPWNPGSALPGQDCDDGDPNTRVRPDANCNCTGGLVDDRLACPVKRLPGTAAWTMRDPNTNG